MPADRYEDNSVIMYDSRDPSGRTYFHLKFSPDGSDEPWSYCMRRPTGPVGGKIFVECDSFRLSTLGSQARIEAEASSREEGTLVIDISIGQMDRLRVWLQLANTDPLTLN